MIYPQEPAPSAATTSAPPVDPRPWQRIGLLVLLIAFGGFGGWAVAANLAVGVVASGKVAAASSTRSVQHYEGGIVSEIRVADGDRVEAGEVLVVLDDTRARSQLQLARNQYLLNRASEVRLSAELAGSETLTFPAELHDSQSRRVREALAVQQGLFFARRQTLDGTLATLEQQAHQYREQREGLEALIEVSRQRIASLDEEADDLRSLFERGHGDRQRLRELERDLLELEGETAQQESNAASIDAQISENRLQRQILRQEFQQETGERLRDVQAQIAEAEERITALADEVRRTAVRAPVAGSVVDLRLHSSGAVIDPGDAVLDIVPADEGFVVEARIPVHEIDSLHPGQTARIRFTAFDQRASHAVEGELVHLSADSLVDETTGSEYYLARIAVDDTRLPEEMRLVAGMPAEVMIHTGERSFASYLLEPFSDVLARAMRG
ncbi:HlyD family type I secretion periplasmic adaptor subunit [Billgrantia desiderata]|uniref:HlyD family type I secretion periplasmic adaptor subunit n=1 Tax=Billgrantia desiderata TaxID=52021 RepID=UPI00089E88AA|nr:HlyD family type I secretion periplasmic adaptor subunit [Halomonas desiderata]SEG20328.1 membrane fusion protein, epimerase transport system [Halomonas desiderata]